MIDIQRNKKRPAGKLPPPDRALNTFYSLQCRHIRSPRIQYLARIEQITRPVHISVNIIPQPVSIQIPSALTHIIIPDL